jgi:hypothetical protein
MMATMVRKKKPTHELKISTPRSRHLKWLAEAGIVVPGDIPLDDERVPLDFTRLSSRGIGELQSRYAVRHAHAVYNAALLESDILKLKRELRIAQAKFRIRYRGTPKNVVDALMEEDDEISEMFDRISEIEIKLTVLEAVVKTYEGIRNAASREISRQMGERAAID